MSTVIGIAMSAGISIGQLLAGLVGNTLGWRAPFLFIAIPAILLAILTALTAKEPVRGEVDRLSLASQSTTQALQQETTVSYQRQTEISNISDHGESIAIENSASVVYNELLHPNASSSEQVSISRTSRAKRSGGVKISSFYYVFTTPSIIIIILQGIPGCIPWGFIYVFLNDYLSSSRDFTVEIATASLFLFGNWPSLYFTFIILIHILLYYYIIILLHYYIIIICV